MNRRKFVSLNLQMSVAVILGILLAGGMYLLCSVFQNYVINVNYISVEAESRYANAAYASLEEYIEEHDVKGTDTKSLSKWIKARDYTYVYIYDNYGIQFEAGWWGPPADDGVDQDLSDEESILYSNTTTTETARIDEETFQPDALNRIIQFEDGKYYVYIDVYKEQWFEDLMDPITIVLCFLALWTAVLLYNKITLRRIIRLAGEVESISNGNLDETIYHVRNDEIGTLALSVDNMRNSIIQKHQNEKAAWSANNQLITAMSHDIRTPLTSMIGYLDIIEGKKYNSQEERDKYILSCRDKAFQLKDLSDKLFQYFLVFGNSETDRTLERFDASILFQQLLTEHCAESISNGFLIDFQFTLPEVDVLADISGLKRLFDNVFSNIMKYADKEQTIGISVKENAGKICICAINGMPLTNKKVESTRIGLKTCERICADIHGEFTYHEDEKTFTVNIVFPIANEEAINEEAINEDRSMK